MLEFNSEPSGTHLGGIMGGWDRAGRRDPFGSDGFMADGSDTGRGRSRITWNGVLLFLNTRNYFVSHESDRFNARVDGLEPVDIGRIIGGGFGVGWFE